jgi:hypothetical protein
MTAYTVQYQGRCTLADVNAHALRFDVRSDNAPVQHVEILVSGADLENRWGITSDHQRFWPAVAVVGLRAIRNALLHNTIPTTTPGGPWTHYVNRSAVDRIISSDADLPVLAEHADVARFSA